MVSFNECRFEDTVNAYESTGFGYAVGAALDAATSAAFAWAIGSTAKAYFRNEYLGKSKLTKEELGEIFRKAFRDQKNK